MRFRRVIVAGAVSAALAGCGGAAAGTGSRPAATKGGGGSTPSTAAPRVRRPAKPVPGFPHLFGVASGSAPTQFVPVVVWRGHTAAWIARSASGVALLSFNQSLAELRLHSGTIDAGTSGWRWGPSAAGREAGRLMAAFNGGFKLAVGDGGFVSGGRVGAALRDGLGSIVTYTDGSTDIGSWHGEVPATGRTVASVRQNLPLLIDHGTAAASVNCLSCWGATLGGVSDPARSALGITADRRLVWAGGEHLTPAALASALLGAQVVRAVELDINPEWVAAYLYGHRGGHGPPAPVPIVPGQHGVSGEFLTPYSRDFFTIDAR